MSNFKVEILPIQVIPHPNADALELALVGPVETAYRCVVPKGKFESGELVAYIPEAAILPAALIEEMGLTGRLAGSEKNRVKAVKLRGELSQGLVWKPEGGWQSFFDGQGVPCPEPLEGADIQVALGITKYQPAIPAIMTGKMLGDAPAFADHTDMENIKQYSNLFSAGEMVFITEKIHGTQMSVIFDGKTFKVSSKGLLHKYRATLAEDPGNLYWQAFHQNSLEAGMRYLYAQFNRPIQLVGEVYGKVQDLTYGMSQGHKFAAFDLRVCGENNIGYYVDSHVFFPLMEKAGIPTVPLLYAGPYNLHIVRDLTDGSTVAGFGAHIREGVVVKPMSERNDSRHGRVILKSVSEAYLLRKGNVSELE